MQKLRDKALWTQELTVLQSKAAIRLSPQPALSQEGRGLGISWVFTTRIMVSAGINGGENGMGKVVVMRTNLLLNHRLYSTANSLNKKKLTPT